MVSTGRLNEVGLKAVFNKFDVDHSGAVDANEMASMIKMLKLDMSPAQVKALMREADPDGSGLVEYAEFVSVLKRQLQSGEGGLQSVVNEASSAFGWLNPLSWFGPGEAEPAASVQPPPSPVAKQQTKAASSATSKPHASGFAAAAAAKPSSSAGARPASAQPRKRVASPASKAGSGGGNASAGRSATPKSARAGTPKGKSGGSSKGGGSNKGGGSKARAHATPGQRSMALARASSPSSPSSPNGVKPQRIKITQAAVREEYMRQAQQIRNEALDGKRFLQEQQENARRLARENVQRGHQQAVERAEAIEALKKSKRDMGSEMKTAIEKQAQQAAMAKKDYVNRAHNTVFDAKNKKRAAARAREIYKYENATQISEAAKVEREARRQAAKATVRMEEQAAKDYTANVRYETRRQVRQEGAEMFQRQRDAAAEARRQAVERDNHRLAAMKQAYMDRASAVKAQVEALHESTRMAREKLADAKREAAFMERERLAAERERKRQMDAERAAARQKYHDDIYEWKQLSAIDA